MSTEEYLTWGLIGWVIIGVIVALVVGAVAKRRDREGQ